MFATTAKNIATMKLTENGAVAYSTTENAILDLFAQIGALRPRTEAEIENKFANAFAVDPLIATKMLFYAGNIRGGLGERRTFRICLKWLAWNHPSIVRKNLALIPHFNRWDSLFVLVGTPVETDMWILIKAQLNADLDGALKQRNDGKKTSISLLAKWMPTETAHKKEIKALAKKAMVALALTPRQYRKMLTALRKHIGVVESLMSAGKWDEIDYPAVPSYAMKNYRDAFKEHDMVRFAEYKESLAKGETKVNASTLYPYDLVHEYMGKLTCRYLRGDEYRFGGTYVYECPTDPIIEAQWKALPNYVTGENNILCMCDVSGSMSGRPMETSIGLGTYFAQHATSDFHNLYLTFTSEPHFVSLDGKETLASAVAHVRGTDMGYSTDLYKAFKYVLNFAKKNNINPETMPKAMVVISDMEIDPYFHEGRNSNSLDFIKTVKAEYAAAGYEAPVLVLWNVEARNDTFLSKNDVIFVSGQSPSIFKNLCGALNGKTAWDFMMDVLNDEIYDCVVI